MANLVPYKGNDSYIFISYSHRDSALVLPIIERMYADGFRVWYDEGIDPGTEWDEFIAEHIQSCGYFIAFMSENYLASSNCKDELNYARDLEKNRLIVYLGDVSLPAGMAMRINRLQSIFYHKYDDKEKFYEVLYSANELSDHRGAPESAAPDPITRSERLTFDDGEYEGEVRDGVPYGRGIYRYSGGSVYEGMFDNGKPHGSGVYRFADGSVYEGEFALGKRHGHGSIRSTHGDVYVGSFADNLPNGRGIYTWADGNEYEGEYKNGQRHGHGAMRYSDGNAYEGEWKNDKRHGYGTLKSGHGDVYTGEFALGMPNGRGVFRWAGGNAYDGEWKNSARHGNGIVTEADGETFRVTYDNDREVSRVKIDYRTQRDTAPTSRANNNTRGKNKHHG